MTVLLCQAMDVAFPPLHLPYLVSQLLASFRVPFILPLFPGKALPGLQELGLESPQLITLYFSACFSISFPHHSVSFRKAGTGFRSSLSPKNLATAGAC